MTEHSADRTAGVAADQSAPAQNLVLVASLNALARAGEIEAACRLAGQACVALRRTDPTAVRRFDVLLHRLVPKLTWQDRRGATSPDLGDQTSCSAPIEIHSEVMI